MGADRALRLARALARVLLAVVAAVLVAHVGLALAAPHFAPQEPNCPWSFAQPGSPTPPTPPLCPGAQGMARPLAVKRATPLPLLLLRAAGVTLAPLALAMLLAALIGLPLGAWAAARPRSRLATALLSLSAAGAALPGFLVAFAMVYAEIFWVSRTGRPLIQFTSYRFDPAHLAMPTLTLACAPAALLAQATVAALGTVYDQDYIRAARGRGIEGVRLLRGHVLPVAAPTLLAAAAAGAQLTLTTIPLLEYLFNWPGLGHFLLDAIEGQDRAALPAILAIFAASFTALGLLADRARPRPRAERVAGAA